MHCKQRIYGISCAIRSIFKISEYFLIYFSLEKKSRQSHSLSYTPLFQLYYKNKILLIGFNCFPGDNLVILLQKRGFNCRKLTALTLFRKVLKELTLHHGQSKCQSFEKCKS